MGKKGILETLVTATITGIIEDDNAIYIAARSLFGKTRNYLITVADGELTVSVLEGSGNEEKEKK